MSMQHESGLAEGRELLCGIPDYLLNLIDTPLNSLYVATACLERGGILMHIQIIIMVRYSSCTKRGGWNVVKCIYANIKSIEHKGKILSICIRCHAHPQNN